MAAAIECAGGVLVFCGFGGIGLVDGLESGRVARTGSGIGVRFSIWSRARAVTWLVARWLMSAALVGCWYSADLGCQTASARWLMSAVLVGCWYSAVFVLL